MCYVDALFVMFSYRFVIVDRISQYKNKVEAFGWEKVSWKTAPDLNREGGLQAAVMIDCLRKTRFGAALEKLYSEVL